VVAGALVAGQRGGVLNVYSLPGLVGWLDEDATATYSQIMDAAAQREELPCVESRLTPVAAEAGYLLEVALPGAATRAQ
jgi:hypothetical protein